MISPLFSVIGFILFGVLPLISALTMEKWFWRLPLIGDLEEKKVEWDLQDIWLPPAAIPIAEYRMQKNMGAKITVTHHLADVASDIKHRLMYTQVRTFIFTLLGLVFIFIVQYAATRPQATSQVPQRPVTQAPTVQVPQQPFNIQTQSGSFLAVKLLATYTAPFSALALLVEAVALVLSLIDQTRKYERLLNPPRIHARIPRAA